MRGALELKAASRRSAPRLRRVAAAVAVTAASAAALLGGQPAQAASQAVEGSVLRRRSGACPGTDAPRPCFGSGADDRLGRRAAPIPGDVHPESTRGSARAPTPMLEEGATRPSRTTRAPTVHGRAFQVQVADAALSATSSTVAGQPAQPSPGSWLISATPIPTAPRPTTRRRSGGVTAPALPRLCSRPEPGLP